MANAITSLDLVKGGITDATVKNRWDKGIVM